MELFCGIELGGNPWFWLIVWIFFMLIEWISVSAISIWFAVGSFITFIFSFFTSSATIEFLIFTTVSLFTVFMFRQWALSKLKIGKVKTNVEELIGQEAFVTEAITFPEGGRVKLKGNSWRCLSDSNMRYEIGSAVTILRVEGVTVYIE